MKIVGKSFRLLFLWLRYTIDFWKANLLIARQVLSPRISLHAESVDLPTEVEKPIEILALANAITFTPGTLVTEIEPGGRLPGGRMQVHVLGDPDEARESIPENLEKPILKITRNDD